MGQKIFVQFLGFFVFVVLPAFVSAIAPISVAHFTRLNDRVTAELTARIFYMIPYRHVMIEDVQSVENRHHSGTVSRQRSDDRKKHQSESESFLVVRGRETSGEVSVSPVNIEEVLSQAQAFVKDRRQTELRLTVVANWKFSVIAPLLLSPLLIAYIVGLMIGVGKGIARLVRG